MSPDVGFEVTTVNSKEELINSYSDRTIPLIKNAENIITYQICHANGKVSINSRGQDYMPEVHGQIGS